MPVVSPSRYTTTSNSLSGSYRSTLTSTSSLDKPYYRTSSGTYVSTTLRSSLGDRTTEYRSRYSDVDGKRERKSSLVEYSRNSRAPSVTDSDSGISTRYRSERSESRSRDISTTRSESSKTSSDPLPRNKRRDVISSAALAMSTADLYNKYSPANYVPLTERLKLQANQSNYGEIARSKSISNDIGRPPAADGSRIRKPRNSTATSTITEKPEGRRYKETSPSPSYSKRNSMTNGVKDNNGNEVPSVSEIRKRFDLKMAVTKLPAHEGKYGKSSVEQYLSQLKDCENGTGYTKVIQDEKPVPVHMPCEKNGTHRWEIGSSSSRSNSNSDLSISKTISEPASLSKPAVEKNGSMTTSLTYKLPSDRLASIKTQLDPNNPIGKILEKSTVIQVENGDVDYVKKKSSELKETALKNDIEKQVKTPKHTSNFASYIQISQPIASGTSSPTHSPKTSKQIEINTIINDELSNDDVTPTESNNKSNLKYIDSEEDRLNLDSEIESPTGTGFENKTFEHENFLKKRTENRDVSEKEEDGVKSMETSTESTFSEDSSPETPSSRRKLLDAKDIEDIKAACAMRCGCRRCYEPRARAPAPGPPRPRRAPPAPAPAPPHPPHNPHPPLGPRTYGVNTYQELAGGRSGAGALRRSSERSERAERPDAADGKCSQASGLNGLRNIGNTCFMNSVLQCLSNTRPLLEYMLEDEYAADINTTLSCMKGALIKAFGIVIKELWRAGERDSVVNTTSLKSQVQRFAPRFMGYSQQDAQEFLRYLLEGLHEDVNRVTVKPKPILTEIDESLSDSAKALEAWSRYLRTEDSRVGDIFVGQLKSTLRCTHCNHDSVTFDPFWDLSLPIPARTGNLKLQQCLQHFTKHEEMDGDEKPTCSKCGVRRKCLKWFTVHKFPRVLVLHLKRFSPLERFRGKLSVVVEFPLTGLDMGPFAAQPGARALYNLYAVSNHSGTTYSGHYTAYCKHPYTGDWHEYNDSRVTPISPRSVVSAEAYVLFYELAREA